jgi:hypothetical protein
MSITFTHIANHVSKPFTEALARPSSAFLLRTFDRHDEEILDTIVNTISKRLATPLVSIPSKTASHIPSPTPQTPFSYQQSPHTPSTPPHTSSAYYETPSSNYAYTSPAF